MSFISQLRANGQEFVIDDSNYLQVAPANIVIDGEPVCRGYEPRDWSKFPYGSNPFAQTFDASGIKLIDRSKWAEIIQQKEGLRNRLSDISDQAGLISLNQGNTNYCWANAVITAMEVLRARDNFKLVKLSSASVAAPIKGFRNVGGWGSQALEYIVTHGVASVEFWPPNATGASARRYMTDAMKANALQHRITEWYELDNRNFNQLMTLVLLNIPVPIGLNWWRHEVCAFDGVVLGRDKFGIRIRNSWGDGYGDHGFAVLSESKATPDDAVAPRVVTPSYV